MAATRVLVDTGPLVAYLNRHDRHHPWAVKCWSALFEPLWTCEAVVSEAAFVLQSERLSVEPLLRLLERRLVRIGFAMDDHRADVIRLLRKYADQPMSVADACLVRMAELTDSCQVFTTDEDFRVYRRKGRHIIPLLAPPERRPATSQEGRRCEKESSWDC
jgi:predicted nucleic acid-binding protein